MPIKINLRHLEEEELRIGGQLPVGELDIDARDDIVQVTHPLEYDLTVERLESGLLVQGRLFLPLECTCVRCLKPFRYELKIEKYSTLLVLEGDEAIPVVNDCVDLTGQVREDILLEFPQHPLCDQECRGLLKAAVRTPEEKSSDQTKSGPSAWAELNKLKF
jgi:uncharacterized protein